MRTIKKHRRYIYLILFLIIGLYIDIKMMSKDRSICWDNYRQRTLNIQTVIPFHPDRFTLYLGIGNRHWEYNRSITDYINKDTGQILEREIFDYGCSKGGYSYPRYMSKYINLRPFSEILEKGIIKTHKSERVVSFEYWEEWYR